MLVLRHAVTCRSVGRAGPEGFPKTAGSGDVRETLGIDKTKVLSGR
jgi:hypothetical protein